MFPDKKPKEEPTKDELDETTNLPQDKIFDNKYEQTAFQGPDTNFTLSSQYNHGKDFMESVEARMLEHGRPIGVKYAEGFTVERFVGVEDLFDLK